MMDIKWKKEVKGYDQSEVYEIRLIVIKNKILKKKRKTLINKHKIICQDDCKKRIKNLNKCIDRKSVV